MISSDHRLHLRHVVARDTLIVVQEEVFATKLLLTNVPEIKTESSPNMSYPRVKDVKKNLRRRKGQTSMLDAMVTIAQYMDRARP